MGLNYTVQQGRLTTEPKIYRGSTDKGDYIYAHFRIAVSRDYRNSDGSRITDFKNCEAFGQVARFIEEFYHTGDLVIVAGSWYTKEYEKDGVKRNHDYISVHNTYPSRLRGREKPIEKNLADTINEAFVPDTPVVPEPEVQEDIPLDLEQFPTLPEEYHQMFR